MPPDACNIAGVFVFVVLGSRLHIYYTRFMVNNNIICIILILYMILSGVKCAISGALDDTERLRRPFSGSLRPSRLLRAQSCGAALLVPRMSAPTIAPPRRSTSARW